MEQEKLEIANPKSEKWAFQMTGLTKECSLDAVNALTMDKLLEIAQTDTFDILKLDIEGGEVELFSSNYETWLDKTNVIIIELHDRLRDGCSKNLYSAASHYDFWKKSKRILLFFLRKPLNN
jgi:hypothetical protein